ncbi:MAG: ABC transporter substrate-binding protein [Alphaproteobacteria bacterium]
MKRILFGAFALSLTAFPARADIVIAVVAPLTGQDAGARRADEARRRCRDRRGQRGGRRARHKLRAIYKDDGCDPKQGVAVANQLAGEHALGVIGPNCSGVAIPVSKILAEENIVMVFAFGHQSHVDRARADECLPGLRPRRPAGRARGELCRRALRGKERRHHSRQDRLWPRARRRDEEGRSTPRRSRKSCSTRSRAASAIFRR